MVISPDELMLALSLQLGFHKKTQTDSVFLDNFNF
jgi:hypothetical protein